MHRIRREKVHALILARQKSGEADRVVTLFTREYGRLRVTAKGVRKIPSRRGGYLEPLTHVLAVVAGSAHHYFLAAVEPVNEYQTLRTSPDLFSPAQRLATLVLHAFAEEESQPTVFDALHQAWSMLPELPLPKQQLLETAFMLHVLTQGGWQPDLTVCHRCRITTPRDSVILDSLAGGWRCLSCHSSLAGTKSSLTPRLLKALQFIAQQPERVLHLRVTEAESEQIVVAVQQYVAEVLGTPAPVSSPIFSSSRYAR